ncbi:MAG TPA: recombinase family protein, partial [Symbiobacteriaceae bacterium]|nr:recombinase family protein [Symbiobacteriaceae bacterium]
PSVGRILRNPAYAGRLVYGRTRIKGGRKVAADEPLVVRDGFYPPIVSPEEFAAAEAARAQRPGVGRQQGTGRSLGSQALLSGLLRCPCGRACTSISLTARGVAYRYYACGGAQNTGAHLCAAGNMRQELLDSTVTERLLALFRGREARERLLGRLSQSMGDRMQELAAAKEAAGREVRRLEESERRLRGLFIDGKLRVEEFRTLAADVADRISRAQSLLREAEAAEAGARRAIPLERVDEWEALAPVERKQLLRQFVRRVTADRDRESGEITCEIDWALAPETSCTS